jgi:hypothetical protein
MKDRNINIVNPKENMIEPFKKIRVCAYVRVSTVNEKQQDSLRNQKEYYKKKIDKNPDYVNCGVYSDYKSPSKLSIICSFRHLLMVKLLEIMQRRC